MKGWLGIIKGDGLRASVIRSLLGGAGSQIIGMGLSFLVGVQLAHGLGAAGYGIYAFALSTVSLVGIITEFGLPQVALREASVATATHDWGLLRGVALFSCGGVAIFSLAITIAVEVTLRLMHLGLDVERRSTIEWGLLLIPLAAQTKILSYMLMGLGHIALGQFANLVMRPGAFALFLAIAMFLASDALSPERAISLQVLGTAVSFVYVGGVFIGHAPSGVRTEPARIQTRRWIAAAWPMAMTEGLRVAQTQMSVLLLGVLSTPLQTGLFRVADSTATMCGVAISLLNSVAISFFARLWANGERDQLQKLVHATTAAIMIGVLVITVPVAIFGKPLLEKLFGVSFGEAYPTLLVACCSNFAFGMFGLCGSLLNMTGHERRVTRAIGVSLATSLALSVLIIPILGSRGAAAGNVIGLFVWNILVWRDVYSRLKIDTSIFQVWQSWRVYKHA